LLPRLARVVMEVPARVVMGVLVRVVMGVVLPAREAVAMRACFSAVVLAGPAIRAVGPTQTVTSR